MKFAMKSLVAAAALAAVGYANAAPVTGQLGQAVTVTDPLGSGRTAELTLLSGSGALAFSNTGYKNNDPDTLGGLLGALNVGGVVLTGTGGVTVKETSVNDAFGDPIRVTSVASAPVVALTADNVTGQVLSVQSTGGAVQTGTRIKGTLNGGIASVTNLRFDLAGKGVYADLVGTPTNGATTTLPSTLLWTIGNISGPTVIPPAALLAADPVSAMTAAGFSNVVKKTDARGVYYEGESFNTISGLAITTAGFNFFSQSLGLLATGVNALAAVTDYGTVSSQLKFSVREVPSIPEPSTYALMGLGLVGMTLVARRRAK